MGQYEISRPWPTSGIRFDEIPSVTQWAASKIWFGEITVAVHFSIGIWYGASLRAASVPLIILVAEELTMLWLQETVLPKNEMAAAARN
jgi:hypothetical protein